MNLSLPNADDSVDEVSEAGEDEGKMDGAKLSVTQFDDPLSGGHFAGGASKAPLGKTSIRSGWKGLVDMVQVLTPGPPENVVE